MAFLTFEKYNELNLMKITKETEFDALLTKALMVMHAQTRNFYEKNDFETDVPLRKERFMLALALQVEHLFSSGLLTSDEADSVQSWSVDGVSVSSAGRNQTTFESNRFVSKDAMMALSGTGLLYKGVSQ